MRVGEGTEEGRRKEWQERVLEGRAHRRAERVGRLKV